MAAPRVVDSGLKLEVQKAVRWAIRGTLLLWLAALTWTSAVLYEQVVTMRRDIVKGMEELKIYLLGLLFDIYYE